MKRRQYPRYQKYPSKENISGAENNAAYGSETPALQPAYQQPTQPYSHPAQTMPAVLLNDTYRETLGHVSSAIRHDVDQFLVALPLGTSPDDAAVEEAMASKLYEALLSKAVMQHKLTEWAQVATQLKDLAQHQHQQLRQLGGPTLSFQGSVGAAGAHTRPGQVDEMTELKALIHSLRMDMSQQQQNSRPGSGAGTQLTSQSNQAWEEQAAELQQLKAELVAAQNRLREADSEAKVGRVEQQRMRKALIDAELELQQSAVAAQDKRKALQAAESQLANLKQTAAEAVNELTEERKRGVVKERKLMDRTHEASKLREQLHEAENAHQAKLSELRSQLQQACAKLQIALQELRDQQHQAVSQLAEYQAEVAMAEAEAANAAKEQQHQDAVAALCAQHASALEAAAAKSAQEEQLQTDEAGHQARMEAVLQVHQDDMDAQEQQHASSCGAPHRPTTPVTEADRAAVSQGAGDS
ncbi:hypothetical protein WJX79_003338 [Trebouxia sp. C0005]